MKIVKKFLSLAAAGFCFFAFTPMMTPAFAATPEATPDDLIDLYVEAINDGDADRYITLFTADNQNEMDSYINDFGTDEFFKEESVELKNATLLSDEVGKYSAAISDNEIAGYDDIAVYYVEMVIDAKAGTNDLAENGYAYRDFVIVKEDGAWKILRISSPNLKIIVNADEGFDTAGEEAELQRKKELEQSLIQEAINFSMCAERGLTPLEGPTSDPASITVYFTKTANRNNYGVNTKKLNWTTYLKNVIPGEWTVSRYASYPSYLEAGTMASKMYAWYCIENPKWDYSPFYADVKDNTSDQNFLYNAYDSMASRYRGYVDEVISYVRNVAMCNDDGELFEVHYLANSGTQYSGWLNEEKAYSLAKDGYSTFQILSYFYSYSEFNPGKIVLFGYA